MRKVIYLFVLFFAFPFSVLAIDNDLIYLIDDFQISSDGKMEVDGWAFIDHVDNYGGGNMNSYIIAYTGDWVGDDNVMSQCFGQSKQCFAFRNTPVSVTNDKHTYKSGIGMYFARCTNSACRDNTYNVVRNGLIVDKSRVFSATCTESEYDISGSHCLYENVGFHNEISLEKVFDSLKENVFNKATVKFRIFVQVSYGDTLNNGGGHEVFNRSVDMSVHQGSCVSNGKRCNPNQAFHLSDVSIEGENSLRIYRQVTITGFSDKIYYTAIDSTPKIDSNLSSNDDCGFSDAPKEYYLDTSIFSGGISTNLATGWTKGVYIKAYAIKMSSCGPGNSSTRYIPVSWARPGGAIVIEDNVKDYTTSGKKNSCACVGNKCDVSGDNPKSCQVVSVPSGVGCSGASNNVCPKNGEVVTFDTGACEKHISKSDRRDYYRIEVNKLHSIIENTKDFKSNYNGWSIVQVVPYGSYKKSDNHYLLPITFYSKVSFMQHGTLQFVKSGDYGTTFGNNAITVATGRPFNFSINYALSANWNFYKPNVMYRNRFEIKALRLRNTNGQEKVIDFSTNGSSQKLYVYYDLDDNEMIYYINSESKWTALRSVGQMYQEVGKSYEEKFGSKLDLSVFFPDSNDKGKNINKVMNYGSFSCSEGETGSHEKKMSCNYTIPQAYQDNLKHNVYYGNGSQNSNYTEMTSKGSLYYTPLYLDTGTDFKIHIYSDNLSAIDGIVYKYDATCRAKVVNEIKDFIYRPIDLENPFPKSSGCEGLPSNWKEYCKGNGLSRVTNQFGYIGQDSHISYMTNHLKTLSKYESEINHYGYYYELNEAEFSHVNEKSGVSNFVRNDNIFRRVNGYHCGIGTFSSDCDKVQ